MGLFGGGSITPTININVPKLPTAEELFQQALNLNQENFPLALQAREGALSDLAQGTDFFESFQPTSLEEALSNQFFDNTIRDVERSIKQNLSLSGIASSPVLADQIGRARGSLGVDIGQFLANQGNQRALFSLNSRLGLDPNQQLLPFVNTGVQQGNRQASLDFQAELARAQQDLQNQITKASQPSFFDRALGFAAGGLLGGPLGFAGSVGGSILGALGPNSPIDLGTAFSLANLPNQFKQQNLVNDILQKQLSGSSQATPILGGQ